MATAPNGPISLWRRRSGSFDHSLPLGDTLISAVEDIFAKYIVRARGNDAVDASMHDGTAYGSDLDFEDATSMGSDSSGDDDLRRDPLRVIRFEHDDSEDSMSIHCSDPEGDHREEDETAPVVVRYLQARNATVVDPDRNIPRGERVDREIPNCVRCETYDAHCRSAAEKYRRVLTSYTRTVSELMIGFKKVLDRYPELRVDSSDDHLHYMVQAALGRNNLVQAMVRLAAKRQMREVVQTEPRQGDDRCVSVREALNVCYTDAEAIRMLLERYTDLYVRYVEVWREMSSKVSRDITVMEFVNLTQDRPGVSYGEPWSEAKAYVSRMLDKVGHVTPAAVAEACTRALKTIDRILSSAPANFEQHSGVVDTAIGDIRNCLDGSLTSWAMNDLSFDIRSDLTVLEALVGVGNISVKTLLYERSMLVSQVRKMTRNAGSLELQVAQTRSELRGPRADTWANRGGGVRY